jgi:hypothetical protein
MKKTDITTLAAAQAGAAVDNSATGPFVEVRRQWNDWRVAVYTLSDIDDLHWDRVSGGVNARAPREFLHCYVLCDGMVSGDLAHSCRHGQGPHNIKV